MTTFKIGSTTVIDNQSIITTPVIFPDSTTQTPITGYSTLYTGGQRVYTLDNPNAYGTSTSDYFGLSVAISGNYAIVGAYGEADDGGSSSGKAYIFNVTTGQRITTLNNPNPYGASGLDNFGKSVAISGEYAIVGADGEDESGGSNSGKAYIYNVTTGALVHTLNNPNAFGTVVSDRFGQTVAISGNYAIVGAPQEDDAGGSSAGKAYIYSVTTGALLFTLNDPNLYSTSAVDYFGYSVAISGDYAIVGAYYERDSAGNIASGVVYVYNVTTGVLLRSILNPNTFALSSYDQFGTSASLSGNYAIVGAPGEQGGAGDQVGVAHIYDITTGTLLFTLNNPNPAQNDFFGQSVAISGNYAIVGAYGKNTNSGVAYIYNVSNGALLYTIDNPNAYSTSSSDLFGQSVALSGNYAIVGAWGEDDAGGSDSGKAYIFAVKDMTLVDVVLQPGAL